MSEIKNEDNNPGKITRKENQEIRYIQVESHLNVEDEDDAVDLMELARRIWDGRRTIVIITGVFILFGLFVAIFSASEYESEAILMPEVQQEQRGGASQLLRRFGGQFGLPAGGDTQQGVIPPLIYPRIVNSLSFQLELLEKDIYFREYGITTTWPDFLENHYSKPLTSYVKDYTIGLPFTILGGIISLFRGEKVDAAITQDDDGLFITMNRRQQALVDNLRGRISVIQDQETGLLTTRVKLQDPRAAAELNRHLIELLKQYVTEYRVEKARQNVQFTQKQNDEAQVRFEEAQINLAEFRDRNISLATARAQTELERLQDEKDLAFNVYSSLSQRLEEARLNVQEQTPVFNEVQAVNVPSQASEPKRAQLVIIYTIMGFIISTGLLLLMPILYKVRNVVKN